MNNKLYTLILVALAAVGGAACCTQEDAAPTTVDTTVPMTLVVDGEAVAHPCALGPDDADCIAWMDMSINDPSSTLDVFQDYCYSDMNSVPCVTYYLIDRQGYLKPHQADTFIRWLYDNGYTETVCWPAQYGESCYMIDTIGH